jgi:hypothetical protein
LLPKATRLWLARGWLADLALQRQEIKHALDVQMGQARWAAPHTTLKKQDTNTGTTR